MKREILDNRDQNINNRLKWIEAGILGILGIHLVMLLFAWLGGF